MISTISWLMVPTFWNVDAGAAACAAVTPPPAGCTSGDRRAGVHRCAIKGSATNIPNRSAKRRIFIETPSVRHRIDHEIKSHAIGIAGKPFRITCRIHVFPRVAEIRVVRHDNHQTAGVVGNSIDPWNSVVGPFPGWSAVATVSHIGDLYDLVDIEKRVKDRMR